MTQGYALHIGLNAVDPSKYAGWHGQLFACENDVAVYKSLAEKAGFQEIHMLLTSHATTDNVLQHLRDAAAQLVSGDMLLLTYSGHGGALIDSNHDETDNFGEMSGFDETWCLYDRQLIDDELCDCFGQFSEGVRILVFSDSCHSGSVAKRAAPVDMHTTSDPAAIPRARFAPLDVLMRTYNTHKATYDTIQAPLKTRQDDIRAYVIQFGACQDDELAMEASGNGLFTAQLQQAMREPVSNYTTLFSVIERGFNGRQHPNLFHYGNKAYDFMGQAPFSIQSAPVNVQ